jgi:hypothetical protein
VEKMKTKRKERQAKIKVNADFIVGMHWNGVGIK